MEYSPGSSPFCKQPVTDVLPLVAFPCADAIGVRYTLKANANASKTNPRTIFSILSLLRIDWGVISDSWIHWRVAAAPGISMIEAAATGAVRVPIISAVEFQNREGRATQKALRCFWVHRLRLLPANPDTHGHHSSGQRASGRVLIPGLRKQFRIAARDPSPNSNPAPPPPPRHR